MNDESSYEANRKVRFTRSHHGRLGLRIGWLTTHPLVAVRVRVNYVH